MPERESNPKAGLPCDELRGMLATVVAKESPASAEDVRAAFSGAVARPLLLRVVACDAASGRILEAAAGSELMKVIKTSYDGPYQYLSQAATAAPRVGGVAAVPNELDRRVRMIWDNTIRENSLNLSDDPEERAKFAPGERAAFIPQGRIQKLTKSGDGFIITFKKEKFEVPDFQCTNTGKVIGYQSDGTPHYRRNCKEVGSHLETYELGPHYVSANNVGNLKLRVGQFVKIASMEAYPEHAKAFPAKPGFVAEIDDVKGKKWTPVAYWGIPIKAK
jgi:hypothetical protein